MERYTNLGGDSGVFGYEISESQIVVIFTDGSRYTYTYASAGRHHIEQMKKLARQGVGLNSYIRRVVGVRYASKQW